MREYSFKILQNHNFYKMMFHGLFTHMHGYHITNTYTTQNMCTMFAYKHSNRQHFHEQTHTPRPTPISLNLVAHENE